MMSDRPALTTVPYLPLTDDVLIGRHRLVPSAGFGGRWRDDRFRERAQQLIGRLEDPNGRPLRRPTLIVDVEAGADGVAPSSAELAALQTAIDFGALSTNPNWTADNSAGFWVVLTSDNTEVQVWPIDIDGGYIAFATGRMVQVTHGGWNLDRPGWGVRCPLELNLPLAGRFDGELANATYAASFNATEGTGARQLVTALNWWSKAWRNTPSVDWGDRVVLLKTALEAFTTSQGAWEGTQLREMFEQFASRHDLTAADCQHLLWSPDERSGRERERLDRDGRVRTDSVTDLEHWYGAFSDARNALVHERRITDGLIYSALGSNYEGQMVHSAERLVREAALVLLDELGYPDLWRTGLGRAAAKALRRLEEHQGDSEPDLGEQ